MIKSSSFVDGVISFKNKIITSTSNTKFLGTVTKNSLSWKARIDQFIPKLCTAWYAIRAIKPFVSRYPEVGTLTFSFISFFFFFLF